MNNNNQKLSFEAGINNFREELSKVGIFPNSFVNEENMLEILNRKEPDQQDLRNFLTSITKTFKKDPQQRFQVEIFLNTLVAFHQNYNIKIENAQIQLSNLQQDHKNVLEALTQVRNQELKSQFKEIHRGTAVVEVKQIKTLSVLENNPIYVKLVYNGVDFITKSQNSLESTMRSKKFMFEINSDLEKLQVFLLESPANLSVVSARTEIDIANIKSSRTQWFDLYGPQSHLPISQIKLFLDWIPSKTEYLNQVREKIEEQIAFQVGIIEEAEKNLKALNSFVLTKNTRNDRNQDKFYVEANSLPLSTDLSCNSIETPKKKNISIIKEEELEHLDHSTMNMYSTNLRYRANPATEKMSRKNSIFELNSNTKQFPDLQMSLRKAIHPSQPLFDEENMSRSLRRNLVNEVDFNVQGNLNQTVNDEDLLSLTQELQDLNFTLDSRLNTSQTYKTGKKELGASNIKDLASKDTIISYLEKKLNETFRENEKLQGAMKKLTSENVKLMKENSSIKELKNQIQTLQNVIQNQKKKTVKKCSIEKIQGLQILGKNNEFSMKLSNDIEYNMKTIMDENMRLKYELNKKCNETTFWKNKAQENMKNPNEILDLSNSREKLTLSQNIANRAESSSLNSLKSVSSNFMIDQCIQPFMEVKKRTVKIFEEKENLKKE